MKLEWILYYNKVRSGFVSYEAVLLVIRQLQVSFPRDLQLCESKYFYKPNINDLFNNIFPKLRIKT